MLPANHVFYERQPGDDGIVSHICFLFYTATDNQKYFVVVSFVCVCESVCMFVCVCILSCFRCDNYIKAIKNCHIIVVHRMHRSRKWWGRRVRPNTRHKTSTHTCLWMCMNTNEILIIPWERKITEKNSKSQICEGGKSCFEKIFFLETRHVYRTWRHADSLTCQCGDLKHIGMELKP